MDRILFDGWPPLFRTALIGVLAYITLIIFLRVSGKRTLSKMNAFDFVVTVAIGSTLATILLSKDVTLAQGAVAFAVLVGMQFLITWSSVRLPWIRRLITGEPALLLHRGVLLRRAMRRTRVTEEEVRAAVRASGLPTMEEAEAVVLETAGSFSVLRRSTAGEASSLTGVKLPDGDRGPPAV